MAKYEQDDITKIYGDDRTSVDDVIFGLHCVHVSFTDGRIYCSGNKGKPFWFTVGEVVDIPKQLEA